MYTYLTFASARAMLASRLQDPTLIYWSGAELDSCIVESLRLFQALTGSYKQKIAINTSINNVYYDLPSLAPAALGYSVTDVEVANNVLSVLLEPQLSVSWSGTGQFTFAQLQSAFQNRLNRFLGETGCVVTQQTVNGPPPPVDLIDIPDSVLDVRRAAWIPLPGQAPVNPPFPASELDRIDEWAEQVYLPGAAQNPDVPTSYSVFGVPPVTLRLIPPPADTGNVDCLFVLSGPTVNLNPAAPVVLGIPDDLTPALKYGILADLFGSDGPSRDYPRAQYCEQRYAEIVQVSRIYPSVLTVDINNVTAGVGSVDDLDIYVPDWQESPGAPSFVGMCGRNLACIGTIPDDAYGVGLWVVANAPVNGTYIQISRDQVDPVLDYAQHIASLKMAGAEFDGTSRLYQNWVSCAAAQNGRLSAVSFYRDQAQQPSAKSEIQTPRMILQSS